MVVLRVMEWFLGVFWYFMALFVIIYPPDSFILQILNMLCNLAVISMAGVSIVHIYNSQGFYIFLVLVLMFSVALIRFGSFLLFWVISK